MREIKFRAWDKKTKKYRALSTISFNYENEYGNFNSDRLPKLVCLWGKNCIEQKDIVFQREIKDVIIEQFTGIKDKNGKEIYEGDIVKFKPMKKFKKDYMFSEVLFRDNCWCLNDNNTYYKSNFSLTGVEIIGNIYENPELLEG